MFALAFGIGIFSYGIFLLGLAGLLYKPVLIVLTLLFWGGFGYLKRKNILSFFYSLPRGNYSLFFLVCVLLIVVQAVINSVGLFGPEIGFDALWYHLTLPKLYLQYHAIFHVPGGVLSYSDMPKLTEMLYTAGLAFSSDFFARGIHFIFGILCCVALYKVTRKFFQPHIAILAPLIFYSNLVVGWESISGYIDLSRTFFEIMTVWALFTWVETKKKEWFIQFGLLAGLTFTTKLLAGGSVAMYVVLLLWYNYKSLPFLQRAKRAVTFLGLALLVPLPWLIFAYIHTGNPFYPMFSPVLPLLKPFQVFTPLFFLSSFWNTFAYASDPIHPIYLLSIPFIILLWRKLTSEHVLIVFLAIAGFIVWYFTPQSGGGRYVLAFVPLFTLLVVYVITLLGDYWRKAFIMAVILCSIISIGYRAIANYKFASVITGRETKAHFLANHLDFSLGDFYDVDGYFAKHIKPTDRVLLYGFHNLYYVDFPYIHESWVQKGDTFTYVAVQGNGKPEKFKYWSLVYFNNKTQVRLYTSPGFAHSVWRYY